MQIVPNSPVATVCLLYRGLEELITEEVKGTHEHDPGVVPGLEGCHQESVLANSMRELKQIS